MVAEALALTVAVPVAVDEEDRGFKFHVSSLTFKSSVICTLYSVLCTLYSVICTLYSVICTLNSVLCHLLTITS